MLFNERKTFNVPLDDGMFLYRMLVQGHELLSAELNDPYIDMEFAMFRPSTKAIRHYFGIADDEKGISWVLNECGDELVVAQTDDTGYTTELYYTGLKVFKDHYR